MIGFLPVSAKAELFLSPHNYGRHCKDDDRRSFDRQGNLQSASPLAANGTVAWKTITEEEAQLAWARVGGYDSGCLRDSWSWQSRIAISRVRKECHSTACRVKQIVWKLGELAKRHRFYGVPGFFTG